MPLTALVRQGFGSPPPRRIGLALSGGGDSTALLHLLADWRDAGGPEVAAVTVDHGLRPGSAAEAAEAARAAAALGIAHDILAWRHDGRGNLEASAREGRLRLIAGWARARGIGDIALAHTADDQAETVLMRLARGSGVDGLAGMAPMRGHDGLRWWRPLLAARRPDLRAYLAERGIGWAEDPMNDDPTFARVRARRALAQVAPLGVTVEGLVATAGWMRLARAALDAACAAAEGTVWRQEAGDLVIAAPAWGDLPEETRLRLLAHGLRWVASAPYRPRAGDLRGLQAALLAGDARRTLSGCLVTRRGDAIRLGREPRAVAAVRAPPGAPWDGRWYLTGPAPAGSEVRALGPAGLAALPPAPRFLPRASLLASPAVWRGDRLVAAPPAGLANGWSAEIRPGFAAALTAH